jgi:ABC-type uncharacterized transport system ATPase subunit
MLAIRDLSFTFAENRVKALDGLSLEFADGRLHAVVGENGAGKSTLARLCAGHLTLQSGRLELDGRPYLPGGPAGALSAGVALVPQHPRLAPELNVWQNLALGRIACPGSPTRSGRMRKAELLAGLEAKLRGWGIHLPLDLPAGRLDAAHMHWAAVAEALLAQPTVLFLDEPSAPYSPEEVERLYRLLRRCSGGGMTVAVITHRLQEVRDWADEVHVLRHGRLAARFDGGPGLRTEQLLEAMFGRQPGADGEAGAAPARIGHSEAAPSAPAITDTGLEIRGLRVNDGAGRSLGGLDIQAPPGLVTGLVGIKDQGLDILEDILAGLCRPAAGGLLWRGQPLRRLPRSRLGYIPGKRFQRGIAVGLTIADNLTARDRFRLHPFNCRSGRRLRAWREASGFSLGRDWRDGVTTLSGGMIQRLIFERELDQPQPELVVCAEPYWGLDRHFQAVLRRRLADLATAGACVLVLSSDLDEAMDLADRLIVLHHGHAVLERDRADFDRAELARAMVHQPAAGGQP